MNYTEIKKMKRLAALIFSSLFFLPALLCQGIEFSIEFSDPLKITEDGRVSFQGLSEKDQARMEDFIRILLVNSPNPPKIAVKSFKLSEDRTRLTVVQTTLGEASENCDVSISVGFQSFQTSCSGLCESGSCIQFGDTCECSN